VTICKNVVQLMRKSRHRLIPLATTWLRACTR